MENTDARSANVIVLREELYYHRPLFVNNAKQKSIILQIPRKMCVMTWILVVVLVVLVVVAVVPVIWVVILVVVVVMEEVIVVVVVAVIVICVAIVVIVNVCICICIFQTATNSQLLQSYMSRIVLLV